MNLFFFLAKFLVVLLLAVHVGQQLEGTGFARTQLQNVLQRFACVRIGVIIDVLAGEAIPVIDLALAAAIFNPAL